MLAAQEAGDLTTCKSGNTYQAARFSGGKMDPNALAGMVFTLLLAAMVGGFILLAPLSRRLGLLLDMKANEKNQRIAGGEVRQLAQRVQLLEEEVRLIGERQSFTEALLTNDEHRALPHDTKG
jgi:hypothetical protein